MALQPGRDPELEARQTRRERRAPHACAINELHAGHRYVIQAVQELLTLAAAERPADVESGTRLR